MREKISAFTLLSLSLLILTTAAGTSFAADNASQPCPPSQKEWTFLLYLNGNNSLDRFATLNLNQMETVGSTDDINMVAQWASLGTKKTQRLLVQKDNDLDNVTSPIVQDMGKVDMGDWHNLVDFIRWGAENYPAKHYFVAVWDHGAGWHSIQLNNLGLGFHAHPGSTGFHPTDISWDDDSGNFITTEQLGMAITDASIAIGQKIDIYGSDACLMAMAEVAGEMLGTVDYFVGSQDLEPGAGWPYDTWMARWAANSKTYTAKDISVSLAEEYKKSYSGGSNGTSDATLSVFDMKKLPAFEDAIANLGTAVTALDADSKAKVVAAITNTTSFTYNDYGDLQDFLNQLDTAKIQTLNAESVKSVRSAAQDLVVSNQVTANWQRAYGVSMWLPRYKYSIDNFGARYSTLNFAKATHWGNALAAMVIN